MDYEYKHDRALFEVLQDRGHLLAFLDDVFGFLYRCTDLYKIKSRTDTRYGFDPGVAENIVLKIFHKWNSQAKEDRMLFGSLESSEGSIEKAQSHFQAAEDSYNGAVREGYKWSQTIGDLDICVTVPAHVVKVRQLQVVITAVSLEIIVASEDAGIRTTLIKGQLSWRTNKQESLWSLVPGKHVQVHLEKSQERWWDALFTHEPKLNLDSMDKSRSMNELTEEEQMKIAELMWLDDRKKRGLSAAEDNLLGESHPSSPKGD